MNPLLGAEPVQLSTKISEMGIERPLVKMAIRSGSKMDEVDRLREPNGAIPLRVLEASEDVYPVAPSSKFFGQFPDVDTHSPRILGTQLAEGTRVDAEHGNVKLFPSQRRHLMTAGQPEPAAPSSTQCDPAPIETNWRSPQTIFVGFPAFQKIVGSSSPLDAIPDAEYLA